MGATLIGCQNFQVYQEPKVWYLEILERQEIERKEYFQKIERNGNNFVSTKANFVLNDLKKNSKDEENKMNSRRGGSTLQKNHTKR